MLEKVLASHCAFSHLREPWRLSDNCKINLKHEEIRVQQHAGLQAFALYMERCYDLSLNINKYCISLFKNIAG